MAAIVPISAFQERKSFNCGKRSMNDFLLEKSLSQAYGSTWVMVPEPNSPQIIAFYTVTPDPVDLIAEDDEDVIATVIELERLAVSLEYQNQGIGRMLLVHLIKQTVEAAELYPLDALSLFALDEDAKDWYLRLGFGFREIAPGSSRLILPMETMRQL